MEKPSFGFVLVFILLSLLFLSNSYKLWFKTDAYYQELRDSLDRTPGYFKNFFSRRIENRRRWETEQKIFSLFGIAAVLIANVMVIRAYLG
ncbi:MAG TPA: hypothetical protein DCY14_04790 [Anaerolineae bacterium]|nr:hypothetical protein [Anaerolineae bacterium]HRJ56742.1 hypothetical protein [Anaerolineales bacterium]